jgi:hypothetical protein
MSKKNITPVVEVENVDPIEAPATEIAAEEPKAETPKVLKAKDTPVDARIYKALLPITHSFKGKQRQIVVAAITDFTNVKGGATIAEVTAVVKGVLVAKGGVEPSVRYHLHHLALLGYVEVTNPTYMG